MKKISKPIVFFGSGPVAAASLERLARDFTIEAIVTKPRPSHHKGEVPVLSVAERLGIATHTVSTKKELDNLIRVQPFQSELGILIDFGIIVSQDVIDYFPLGIINSHFSLLPEWRGADPITFAILSGQQQTGVSLMLLVASMDEGPLIAQAPYDITPEMTTPELTNRLIELNDAMLIEMVPLYIAGEALSAPQESVSIAPNKKPTYSRRLTKDDGRIDWQKPAEVIEREIRAYNGWPQSRTTFGELGAIITKAQVLAKSGSPGETAIIDKQPVVFCGKHALIIQRIKPVGKREMEGSAFIAGYKSTFLAGAASY